MGGADVKGKKLKVGQPDVDDLNHVDENLVVNIERLQEVQDELEKINEEASEKVLEIEKKYYTIRKPVYDRRNEIIKAIPDFWLTAFLSHPALCSLLTDEEHKIFKYFSSLDVEEFNEQKLGYALSFHFQPNPFFEETKLTKTVTLLEDDRAEIINTPITWKEGKGIANGHNQDKKGNKRPLEIDGFFGWFSGNQVDDMPDEVGDIIKEDLWPNPLSYFNNEGEEGDDINALGFCDGDKDESDEEYEDDDEEEE